MIKCRVCKELIGPTAVAYKASSGFLDKDDVFHEDIKVLVHRECQYRITLQLIYKVIKNTLHTNLLIFLPKTIASLAKK